MSPLGWNGMRHVPSHGTNGGLAWPGRPQQTSHQSLETQATDGTGTCDARGACGRCSSCHGGCRVLAHGVSLLLRACCRGLLLFAPSLGWLVVQGRSGGGLGCLVRPCCGGALCRNPSGQEGTNGLQRVVATRRRRRVSS